MVSVVVFTGTEILPGDALGAPIPADELIYYIEEDLARMRADLGLDRTDHERFVSMVGDLITFDFGGRIDDVVMRLTEVLLDRAGDHHCRGSMLQDAVHHALRYRALSTRSRAKVAAKVDVTARMRIESVLFVGEGNLSFALSMSRKPRVPASSIVAIVYEAKEDLTDTADGKARTLLKLGCSVKTGVDATQLSDNLAKRQFRTIIFQFPKVASRDPRHGQNPNHVLVTRFLKSARNHLKPGGLVVNSTVDCPFSEGTFEMDEAARKAGFAAPAIFWMSVRNAIPRLAGPGPAVGPWRGQGIQMVSRWRWR